MLVYYNVDPVFEPRLSNSELMLLATILYFFLPKKTIRNDQIIW